MKVTKLHVLEHPFLHGKPSSHPPVHVIWEPHEFNHWHINDRGDIEIGFGGRGIHTVIQNGMYAKVWEEMEEYPDAVASAPVAEAPVDTDSLRHDDGPELAPLDSASDTGEHGELLIARAEVTHLEDQPEPEAEVEVVTVNEPDDMPSGEYTSRLVVEPRMIDIGRLNKLEFTPRPPIPKAERPEKPHDKKVKNSLAQNYVSDNLDLDKKFPADLDLPRELFEVHRRVTEHDTHIEVSNLEPFDATELGVDLGVDDFARLNRPGYGWPSGQYRSLADPTVEFKVPEGNTFFDNPDDLPVVPEVFSKDGKLGAVHPPRDTSVSATRIDLPTFQTPESDDKADDQVDAPKE